MVLAYHQGLEGEIEHSLPPFFICKHSMDGRVGGHFFVYHATSDKITSRF